MSFFPENTDDWRKIAYLLERSANVYITSHVNPDGDAIGCEMALGGFLTQMGKYFRIINHSPTPESFQFLDPTGCIEVFQEDMSFNVTPRKEDVIFLLDMGRFDRCGRCTEFLENSPATKVIIDHHPPEPIEAEVIVVNPRAAATGSLVYDLLCHLDESFIDYGIALAIMAAIVTDTGYFRYGNTTATTHLIAASLYNHGASAIDIRKQLETGYPLCRQKLMGLTLSKLSTVMSNQIAYSYITSEMFEEAGAKREHTEGIIDQMRYIYETKIAFIAIQEGTDRYKVSFRSGDGVSVNKVAAMLGGGGHPRAAGANLIGSLEYVLQRVLDAAESYMKQENVQTGI